MADEQIEVTQADREAAAEVVVDILKSVGFVAPESIERWRQAVLSGECDTEIESQAFARHRIAATTAKDAEIARLRTERDEAYERAAQVADLSAKMRDRVALKHHDYTAKYHNECRAIEAREIAQSIRALKETDHD